jgi:hypothetical protein
MRIKIADVAQQLFGNLAGIPGLDLPHQSDTYSLARNIVMVHCELHPSSCFRGQGQLAFDRLRSSHCPAWQQWRVTGPPHREQL